MEPNAGDIATPKKDVDVAAQPAPTAPAAKIEEPKTATVEDVGDVSDPDEDDLDDLDGKLHAACDTRQEPLRTDTRFRDARRFCGSEG